MPIAAAFAVVAVLTLRAMGEWREITDREPHNGYLILQGGIPEVEEFVASYRR